MTIREWMNSAKLRLHNSGVEAAALESQLLAAHVLLVERPWLLAHPEEPFPELAGESLLIRRLTHEPLAYILGWREFYSRRFKVGPGVLIPRQETEHLVEAALQWVKTQPDSDQPKRSNSKRPTPWPPVGGNLREGTPQNPHLSPPWERSVREPATEPGEGEKAIERKSPQNDRCRPKSAPNLKVLDLGTGSGCIAITLKLESPNLQVFASDISKRAIEIASQNATDLASEVNFVVSDGLASLRDQTFDAIVSNPPYIANNEPLAEEVSGFEPNQALFAGQTGLEFYEHLAKEAGARIRPQGRLFVEVGYRQAAQVAELFTRNGWKHIETQRDLSGIERVVICST